MGNYKQNYYDFFPVIVRTLIVQYVGAAYLGLGSLFSSILTVLRPVELGVSSAIVFNMYKPIAEDDTKTICALMALYKKLYSVIGTVIGIIGLFLMPFFSYLIKGECPDDINLYFLYLIYLGNTVVGYYLFAYKNCLLIGRIVPEKGVLELIDAFSKSCIPANLFIIWSTNFRVKTKTEYENKVDKAIQKFARPGKTLYN